MKKKSIVYPIVFMILLTAIFTSILAFINASTIEKVAYNKNNELRKKILYVFDLLPSDEDPEEINRIFDERIEEEPYKESVMYLLKEGDQIQSIAVPFAGPGLWGSITGYIGVDNEYEKVTGIEFITQSETPGLGGRISEDPYKEQYRGVDISEPVGEKYIINRPATGGNVDAISGATQTSTYVMNMLNEDLGTFIDERGGQ